MATQAIVSLVKNGHTFIKIICGCDGYNAEKLVKILKEDRPDNIKDIYIMALESGLGCKECLVVMNSENIVFDGDENIDQLYREKFDDPSFNTRWKMGTADIVIVLKIDDQRWIEI